MTCEAFDEHIERRQYWDLTYPDKTIQEKRSETQMIVELRQELLDAVKARLVGDVPIGFYLSGGIDSATICGMAVAIVEAECAEFNLDFKQVKNQMKCFCIEFEEDTEFDEGRECSHLEPPIHCGRLSRMYVLC